MLQDQWEYFRDIARCREKRFGPALFPVEYYISIWRWRVNVIFPLSSKAIRYLLVQSQQWKHQNSVWNLFKDFSASIVGFAFISYVSILLQINTFVRYLHESEYF